MRQLNLNEIRRDPQLEQLLKPITSSKEKTLRKYFRKVPCSVCGYVNVPGLVICWRCGECLDPRIKKLAEGSP